MEVFTKIPLTLNERIEYGEELRIPASWEEFLDMLEECEYRIEYDENEIISFMGWASQQHEFLTGEIIRLLGNLLTDISSRVYGSNLALHIPGFVRRYYNADCAVVKGKPQEVVLRGSMTAVTNPILLVEVLSFTTRDFDEGRKLRNYKKITSLEQILFVESTEKKVVSLRRENNWQPEIFSKRGQRVPVLRESSISLDELYRKVVI